MKSSLIVLTFSLLFSATSHAKDISVTIDGVNYACSGNTSNTSSCAGTVQAFKDELQYCLSSFGADYCIKNTWPSFKSNSPNCYAEGRSVCLKTCASTFGVDYCMNTACK